MDIPTEYSNQIKQRLFSAEGHLKAVIAMVGDNFSSKTVLFQLYAVQGAIKVITQMLVEDHIDECLNVLLMSNSEEVSREALNSLLSTYSWTINNK